MDCCCVWGAAVRGEFPEFPCSGCPLHKDSVMVTPEDELYCRRHAAELPNWTGFEPMACGARHPLIDNGAPCRYAEGHEKADIPHTTANGIWWRDG